MKSSIRKIGNSRGVLIPASFLKACGIEQEIELSLDGSRIIIEPMHKPRTGWFETYQTNEDESVWGEIQETELETEDWKW
jgi:antitoxin MazE